MMSFRNNHIQNQPIDMAFARSLAFVRESIGREKLYLKQSPQVLKTLRTVALIQSTESSNRIENITAPPERIRKLVEEKTVPQNRSEQEIAGYRDALNTIHHHARDMAVNPSIILQIHRDLFKFTGQPGGQWKATDNTIEERDAKGNLIRVRFKPVPAGLATESGMEELCKAYADTRSKDVADPLLAVAAFVLDFLCIHPFRDGNGRMARLLTLWLLYQVDVEVGRYISLEKIIEDSRETYYDTLQASSTHWHEGRHPLSPWSNYFLGMLTATYRAFEDRVGMVSTGYGQKTARLQEVFAVLPRKFKINDLLEACPDVSRPTITRFLMRLQSEKLIRCFQKGRYAIWEKA